MEIKHIDKEKNELFYEKNAKEYIFGSIDADMAKLRNRFLSYISNGAYILDAGCGSGRDTVAFLNEGYKVHSIDGSKAMCEMASEYIGKEVEHLKFEDMKFLNKFDAIWACASLLHTDKDELPFIIRKMWRALKQNGVIYASFKLGEGVSQKGNRTFTDMTVEAAKDLFSKSRFRVLYCEQSLSTMPGREDEHWVNVIAERMDIENILVDTLQKKDLKISFSESCTGGLIAATLVNVSGSSNVFDCSFVTYANEAKEKLLGVSHDTLEKYGAVSEQTAYEMAEGCIKVSGADIAVVTTGIAGPGGGTKDKPVGLVYIGCSYQGKTFVERFDFSGDRIRVRKRAVEEAMKLALETIE